MIHFFPWLYEQRNLNGEKIRGREGSEKAVTRGPVKAGDDFN